MYVVFDKDGDLVTFTRNKSLAQKWAKRFQGSFQLSL